MPATLWDALSAGPGERSTTIRVMKIASTRSNSVSDRQALALDEGVATLLQRFKLEPSIMAGSPYADLHANDVGLLVVIRGPEKWNVRRIAQSLGAPISTISSALDRLEKRGLVVRLRRPGDRRVVYVELTPAGHRLVAKIRASQVEVCRDMLARLSPTDREDIIRLVTQLAHG
ncbi:MAG: MarR family transcriptional regulator [Candidatus Sulfotelmatobacter sp.]|jgi:DNA-binding MarR family transcriptional regulator